tara:strand:+ start:3314 stop:4039 length:726 start_codon:yes stop_codon:yes gene_type:complete
MRSLILCAGKGSRFNTKEKSIPKCFIELNKKKIIDIQINSLKKNNINEIAIVTGYKSEILINDQVNKYYYNSKWENTNIIYSLFCASDWLKEDDCLISYGDIFFSELTIKEIIQSEKNINILYHTEFMKMWKGRYEDPYTDLESFKINKKKYLTEIGNKVSKKDNIMGQYMGLIYIKKEGWKIFQEELNKINIEKIDFTRALQHLIINNIKVKCFSTKELWGEIDTHEDLNFYERYYANKL